MASILWLLTMRLMAHSILIWSLENRKKIKGKPMTSAAFIELSQEKKNVMLLLATDPSQKIQKRKTHYGRGTIAIWHGQKKKIWTILHYFRHYCPKRQATFKILTKSLSGKTPNIAKIWCFGEKLCKVSTSFVLLGALKKKKKKKIPLEGNTSFLFWPYWRYQRSITSWMIRKLTKGSQEQEHNCM